MPSPIIVQQQTIRHQDLARDLFADTRLNAYAVLDGASNPALLDHLYDGERPEFACLYRGELEPDMAECAPYLARLEQGTAFAEWAIANCLGNHWGIFALSREGLHGLLQHLRKHTMVYNRDNQPRLFRFYDPRVLRWFLRTADAEQLADIFGPVMAFFAEAGDEESHIRFDRPVGQ
ncbi:MAG: DUF4123 domain-containing protein [Proteobacteria bacterium]|nr:DUF4123 domain-containing protein [Pseudomonadota bacterium]